MTKILEFYDYDKALDYYEDQLMHIHQAPVKRSGFKAVAKPVLLLTVLKAIDEGTITVNRFAYDQMEPRYNAIFKEYFLRARQESLTPMHYPWYFMSHDDFWHLSWQGREPIRTESPSAAFIRRNTTHAYLSPDLWVLVSHPSYRRQLMEFLINEKIIAPLRAADGSIAAESGPSLKTHGRRVQSLAQNITHDADDKISMIYIFLTHLHKVSHLYVLLVYTIHLRDSFCLPMFPSVSLKLHIRKKSHSYSMRGL